MSREPDGCTGAPDFNDSWKSCCDEHDEDYEKGMPRAEADRKFHECLKARAKTRIGKRVLSHVYYRFVKLVGWFFYDRARRAPPSADR